MMVCINTSESSKNVKKKNGEKGGSVRISQSQWQKLKLPVMREKCKNLGGRGGGGLLFF